ncbi:expressed unknown protein [Seminavis robusta]|uniref:Uncharacterized protein n=1 Tax=Seminavis robusta TaxID=568900 RepID=A0A9N8HXC3_9STRA|nr:expressed unknown protein [Seminavis robusta]|eukprot:Sro2446_g327971.1  (343) ;mRNA; f:12921-13949
MATVESLLSLTEAAIYMGLPGLCDKVQMCLSRITVECPPMAWKILEASTQNGPVISKPMKNDALKRTRIRIRFNCPNLDVFHGIILGTISADTLMTVVDDLRKLAQTDDRSKGLDDCIGVCRLLKYWTGSPPSTGETKERRLNAAKHLMQCYEQKLLRSDTLSVLFTAPKCEQRWKTQKSHIFATSKPKETDRLEGHVFALGETYQWTVKTRAVDLNGFGSSLWLGIAKSTATLSPRVSCEGLEDCWGVSGERGTVWSDGVSTEFGSTAFFGMSGSRHAITMTLDLSVSNTDNGTLSVTVDDREPLVIASNLCKELKGTGVGYVPVVSADWQVVIIENVREL